MFPFSTLSHLTVHSRSWMGGVGVVPRDSDIGTMALALRQERP